MIKKYFILFIFIFLAGFVSSATLSMGPQQLDFTNEINCQTATIKTDGVKTVVGKVMFSEEGFNERKLTRHKLTPEERGVEITFPKEVVIDNKKQIEVCINAPVGNYHGIILYKIKDAPIQVGIWINATIDGVETLSIGKIVGKELEKVELTSLLVIMPVVWIVVLGVLVVVWRKKEKKYLNHIKINK